MIETLLSKLVALKEEKSLQQKVIDKLTADITETEEALIGTLESMGLEGAKNETHNCSIKRTKYPRIDNWDTFRDHVLSTGNLELLQRRIKSTLVDEIWNNDEEVPGLVPYEKHSIYLSSRRR